MPGVFDSKLFNAEVFQGYVDRLPNPNKTELIKSKALRPRPDLAAAMADQDGGNYITTTMRGLISGHTAQNYDGQTNITPGSTKTFKHSRVVVGRMAAWTEKDFSYDITGGEDFLENIAEQIADYWNEVDQATLVSILKGVFAMTDTAGAAFVEAHTLDITEKAVSGSEIYQGYEVAAGCMGATDLNTCMQQACGDGKGKFSLAIMHSVVATHLENLKLLAYMRGTDENGIERELGIATLNGRVVLVDDSMPVNTSGENPVYTTYVLGEGAIEYTDCGAKVPYEVDRDPKTNGGQDTLYSRQRKCFAPYGISFTQANMSSLSPTAEELENGTNWELVNDQASSGKEYIAHKTIPIAQILSLG